MKGFRYRFLLLVVLVTSGLAGMARADVGDPEALKLAREIQAASHASAMGDQILTQVMTSFTNGLNSANPGKNQEIQDLLNQVVMPELRKAMPDLLDQSAVVYANNFSVDELKQLLAFYQSNIGQKLVTKLPVIMQQSNAHTQEFMQKLMPGIIAKMQEQIKARGLRGN